MQKERYCCFGTLAMVLLQEIRTVILNPWLRGRRNFFFDIFETFCSRAGNILSKSNGENGFWKFEVFTIENRFQKFLSPSEYIWMKKTSFQRFYHSILETQENFSRWKVKILRNFEKKNLRSVLWCSVFVNEIKI